MKFEELPVGSMSVNLAETLNTRLGGNLLLKITESSYIRVTSRIPVISRSWSKGAKRKVVLL